MNAPFDLHLDEGESRRFPPRVAASIDRRWRLLVLAFWLGTCAVLVWQRWGAIHWLALGDTDDNMRLAQVRAWLGGQGWYDLRQYKLDPPTGFNIHWSRLVDLPIAGLYLLARPFVGMWGAWRVACAVAPMLPLGVAMAATAVIVRRLVSPHAYPFALAILLCGPSFMGMNSPLRIDHHGWQLALLMVSVAGLSDPNPRRSGLTVAASSALSLAIGLEMLPYIAFAGAAIALHWVWDEREAARMRTYGLAMAAATTACFLVFASNDNWTMRCDALTPVWLATMVLASLLLAGLSLVRAETPWMRLALCAGAGGLVIAVYALAFPQCFGHRLENVPPEAARLWLSHVREARPITAHKRDVALPAAVLPSLGAVAGLLLLWLRRGTRRGAEWLPTVLFGLFAAALMFWQFRTAPSAQMLAVPALAWAAWAIAVRADVPNWGLGRWAALAVAVLLCAGGLVRPMALVSPETGKPKKPDPTMLANRRCPTLPALHPVALQPAGTVMSFIDVGPRLIATTHHRAVAGPYHRNAGAILDVEHAMRGTPEEARAIMARHGADYLLVCPHLSEATIYQAEAPGGFYAKIAGGWTPTWLIPVALPEGSPWRMWRVRR
ncbi:AcrB/AcrD/AcrF family protein [Sphingomonas sp.]|uniref:AcrB/AcrD/AcrF family protein n=1 Tax=Sphingomonas sp. TaxID=28214 RepID=UPI003B001ED7